MKFGKILWIILSGLFPVPVTAQFFTPAATFHTYPYPRAVSAADVNGDGTLDLISANFGSQVVPNTLTVLTNSGTGVFGFAFPLYVGNGPSAIVTMDVNKDGKRDLISANWNANTLTVLTNHGSGIFGSNDTLNIGLQPACLISADVNGDTDSDLIAANAGSDTLTVLTNNGAGKFTIKATLNVGDRPLWVTAADVNEDGRPDLITANFNDNTLTVLTNNGDGFAFSAALAVGTQPASVEAADVNGDGKPDLISADYNSSSANTLTVLTNDGSGGFVASITVKVGRGPHSVIATDVNDDDKADLISANFDADTLTVLTNSGSGSFGTNATLNLGNEPYQVIAADVNADGKLDLVSANYGADSLSVLLRESPISPPRLAIGLASPNTFIVSWPSPSSGFTLQTNNDLGTTNWGAFLVMTADDGTNKTVLINGSTDKQFYRLIR